MAIHTACEVVAAVAAALAVCTIEPAQATSNPQRVWPAPRGVERTVFLPNCPPGECDREMGFDESCDPRAGK
jgi:hypothetical protein